MSDRTGIEWTDATWNPVTGCDQVSEGCDHCYAKTLAERWWAGQYPPNADGSPRRFEDVRTHPERLDQPLRWRRPRLVFVNSVSDLFHSDVSDEFIDRVFDVMAETPQHTYQVLTKRPGRMASYTRRRRPDPLPNVWLGTSVENQRWADVRIPQLLRAPAAVRFLSCEPLLGPVDLKLEGTEEVLNEGLPQMDWVIVGGESGVGHRPMAPEWAQSLRDQCLTFCA